MISNNNAMQCYTMLMLFEQKACQMGDNNKNNSNNNNNNNNNKHETTKTGS